MNVKKAAQIFSNENCDASEQLREDGYEQFIDSKKLAEFLLPMQQLIRYNNIYT